MYEKNKGSYRLATVLKKQMQRQSEQPVLIEIGEIDASYNLKTDTFSELIPKTDYLICRSLVIGEEGKELVKTEENDIVPVPAILRKLMPGDRVLVAWIGADAIVVDILLPATVL